MLVVSFAWILFCQFWLSLPIHWLRVRCFKTRRSNNLERPPYQYALWLDLLFISFLLLIKSGFVICQFTVGSLNPLNSSPYFIPSIKITSWLNSFSKCFISFLVEFSFHIFISFRAFVTLSLSGLFNMPCLHHSFSEWAFCIRATFQFVARCH